MLDNTVDPRIAAALARNDRYLHEFVEALNLCPYSRRCRESGGLQRAVLLERGGPPGAAGFDAAVLAIDAAIDRFERQPSESIEVALIILPALDAVLARGVAGARAFENLVHAVRQRVQRRHVRGTEPFYCVPFHPDFQEDLANEHRAVRFIRRSPDPTVQLVRTALLLGARHADPSGTHYVDNAGLSVAALMALSAPVSLASRIAQANLRTLHAAGVAPLRALLAEIRSHGRAPDS